MLTFPQPPVEYVPPPPLPKTEADELAEFGVTLALLNYRAGALVGLKRAAVVQSFEKESKRLKMKELQGR